MVAAYRDPDPKAGRDRKQTPITSLFSGVLTVLIGPPAGADSDKRAVDVPAHFARPVPATDRSRRSTTPSNTSAAAPWGFAIITHYIRPLPAVARAIPTRSPVHCRLG